MARRWTRVFPKVDNPSIKFVLFFLIAFFVFSNGYFVLNTPPVLLDHHHTNLIGQLITDTLPDHFFPTLTGVFLNGHIGAFHFATALPQALFGRNLSASALVSTLFLGLLLWAIFRLATQLGRKSSGLFAVATLALFPVIVMRSRIYGSNLPVLLFEVLALDAVVRSDSFRNKAACRRFGILAGLIPHMGESVGSSIVSLLAVFLFSAVTLIIERKDQSSRRYFKTSVLWFLLFFSPLLFRFAGVLLIYLGSPPAEPSADVLSLAQPAFYYLFRLIFHDIQIHLLLPCVLAVAVAMTFGHSKTEILKRRAMGAVCLALFVLLAVIAQKKPNYLEALFPLIAVLAGVGMAEFVGRWKATWIKAVSLSLVLILLSFSAFRFVENSFVRPQSFWPTVFHQRGNETTNQAKLDLRIDGLGVKRFEEINSFSPLMDKIRSLPISADNPLTVWIIAPPNSERFDDLALMAVLSMPPGSFRFFSPSMLDREDNILSDLILSTSRSLMSDKEADLILAMDKEPNGFEFVPEKTLQDNKDTLSAHGDPMYSRASFGRLMAEARKIRSPDYSIDGIETGDTGKLFPRVFLLLRPGMDKTNQAN